jgi:Protein of unknown function (DUF3467)
MNEQINAPQPVDNSPRQANQIQIKATDEKLKGEYSNTMQVMHTKEEFVVDFLNIFPPSGQLVSRVIVTPSQMKLIVNALKDNLKKYEESFGNVTPSDSPKSPIGFQSE